MTWIVPAAGKPAVDFTWIVSVGSATPSEAAAISVSALPQLPSIPRPESVIFDRALIRSTGGDRTGLPVPASDRSRLDPRGALDAAERQVVAGHVETPGVGPAATDDVRAGREVDVAAEHGRRLQGALDRRPIVCDSITRGVKHPYVHVFSLLPRFPVVC